MNNELKPLAARRAELIAECARQRDDMRQELAAVKAPISADGIRGYLSANKKMLLGVAGVAVGLVATRPKRLLSLATAGVSLWKMAQGLLPLLRR